MSKTQPYSTSSSGYVPYSLEEINTVIKIFCEKYPLEPTEPYQTTLNLKLLYIIKDLLFRIEKLEADNIHHVRYGGK